MSAGVHDEALRFMRDQDWPRALARIDLALAAAPNAPHLLLSRVRCLMSMGRRPEALAALEQAERSAPSDPALADAAGTLYNYCNEHRRALVCYDRAVNLAPRHPQYRYNRASIRRFLGRLEEAEQDYDLAIAANPADFEAYKNRSDLRTQTAERNHIAELESLLARPIADWRGEVQLRYALAKEYEDLGDYARSFDHLALGARKRHQHLRYDIARDEHTVQWIMDAFPSGPAAAEAEAQADRCDDAPIFVVGLPRSGTTLAERILGSHSELYAAGELDCFALSLVDAVRRKAGSAAMERRQLVAWSAAVDFPALGRDYVRRVHQAVPGAGRFVDKMPLNYLYCGLIRRALPRATIVHVTRHPMAVCYAMYKTLFKDGYPFSYDLAEIGRYYIAYRRLMAHWQTTMPGAMYELRYESLIADQPGETRKLLEFCGLDWQDGCLRFHENPSASTTASAAQVRRPLYDSSVSQWLNYERQLAPLKRQLESAGIGM